MSKENILLEMAKYSLYKNNKNYSLLKDLELVVLARSKDSEATLCLFKRYKTLVDQFSYRFFKYVICGNNHMTEYSREDYVSECYLALHQCLESINIDKINQNKDEYCLYIRLKGYLNANHNKLILKQNKYSKGSFEFSDNSTFIKACQLGKLEKIKTIDDLTILGIKKILLKNLIIKESEVPIFDLLVNNCLNISKYAREENLPMFKVRNCVIKIKNYIKLNFDKDDFKYYN